MQNLKKTKGKEGIILILTFLHVACSMQRESDSLVPSEMRDKSLLIYAVADNSLRKYADSLFFAVGDACIPNTDAHLLLYLDDGNKCTLYKYEAQRLKPIKDFHEMNSIDAENLRDFFSYTQNVFPAKENGLILWSHGTGWLPSGRMTRSFGDDKGESIDFSVLADCMGDMQYDYVIFDACYMGCVEVAWEFLNHTKYFVASPEEIPAKGILYNQETIAELLADKELIGRLKNVCDSYVTANSSYTDGKSVSVVDTRTLLQAANVLKEKQSFCDIDIYRIKCYDFRKQKIFFDLKDFLCIIGEDSLYTDFVAYCNYDKKGSQQRSGLSIFIPFQGNAAYKDSYSVLNWNIYMGWLQRFCIEKTGTNRDGSWTSQATEGRAQTDHISG